LALCPVCKTECDDSAQSCVVCGFDFENDIDKEWILLGYVDDKALADLGCEALRGCDMPAIVISKSGFFGTVGLPLNPFYGAQSAGFEIWTPASCADEAAEILLNTLGDKWQRKEP
jgi:hypothetical protein